jgi:hypothetical protein
MSAQNEILVSLSPSNVAESSKYMVELLHHARLLGETWMKMGQ